MQQDTDLIEYLAEHDAECPSCGYQLRNLTVPRCPECATAFTLDEITPPADGVYPNARASCIVTGLGFLYVIFVGVPATLVSVRMLIDVVHIGQAFGAAISLTGLTTAFVIGPVASCILLYYMSRDPKLKRS